MKSPLGIIAAICALFFSMAAWADWNDPHVEGAKEHRLLKFYPQASVVEYDHKEFDSAEMVTAYKKGGEKPAKPELLEGKLTKYHYHHKPTTSVLEIIRQYETALKSVGFVTIVAGKGSSYPNLPETNDQDGFGAFRLDRNGKPVAYVQVLAQEDGVNINSFVNIMEIKGMEQTLEANADTWFDEISKTGRVAVYGINFDTGKAVLKPESEKVLAEIKKLAISHPQLKLNIEGHTDNVGNVAANKKLSEDRAAAVKAWLTRSGANSANFTTQGFGDAKPVDDNKTEAGRAKNRRVELVKQGDTPASKK